VKQKVSLADLVKGGPRGGEFEKTDFSRHHPLGGVRKPLSKKKWRTQSPQRVEGNFKNAWWDTT